MSNKKHAFIYSSLILLTGCASYTASNLEVLPVENAIFSNQDSNVSISWQTLDEKGSEIYLGRNVIKEGYIPLQMTIRNNSNDPMYFNPSNLNTPISSTSEVANKVHTSTGGRVAAWGIGGLIFFPLLVPAVVDGLKSANANDALDADYHDKALKEQTIQPHSIFNGVVFVPKRYADQNIQVYLINLKTNQKVAFTEISLVQR